MVLVDVKCLRHGVLMQARNSRAASCLDPPGGTRREQTNQGALRNLRKIIDLSHPLCDGMPVFPGDPAVTFEQTQTISQTGYNVTRLCTGTHAGTHLDVPRHCIHGERGVDRVPLDVLVGWAEVLDLPDKGPGSEITAADLDTFASRIEEGARVLVRTGWSKRFGQADFFSDFPGVTEGAALWLTARKVRLFGLEQPSVHPRRHLEVHKALLSAEVVVIETMANLHELTQDRVYLAALPLRLAGLDGSPARVIAIEGDFQSEA